MPKTPASLALPRPSRPDFIPDLPGPPRGITGPARRGVKRLLNGAVDSGWFGLRPLRTHVVACGFPRAGSTLLQLMIEACVSDVRTFGTEYEALVAAPYALRNHPYMFTKDPHDVFYLDEIRAFYASRRADVRFIINVRDQRAVLTSIQNGISTSQPDGYWLDPGRWAFFQEHVRYAQQFDDVLTVEYQDLVCHPAEVQRRLTEFIGWQVHLPFDQFHTAVPPDFDRRPLNGVRPLDPTRLDAWRQEKHRARIRRLLREIPELPEYLIEMGYESDTSWVQAYIQEDIQSWCGPTVHR
jgi:hypothetical protein